MTAIIVLGGHRTGTSIAARLVHELGFPAAPSADRLITPRAGRESDNPDGYFEDRLFVHLHRQMLGESNAALGGWRNPRRDDAVIHRLRPRYQRLVRQRAATPAWSLKDPRLCLLSDVLVEAVNICGIPIRVVTTTRPLDQTVASLRRRGLSLVTAQRVAEHFEAARQAALHDLAHRDVPILEIRFTELGSFDAAREAVSRLGRFVDFESPQRLASLVKLVRIAGTGIDAATELPGP
jgi:hypothetical protein